jgi:hypothetical protein
MRSIANVELLTIAIADEDTDNLGYIRAYT